MRSVPSIPVAFRQATSFFTALETPSAPRAAPPPGQPLAKPAEFKVLERLRGQWRYEWESRPTSGDLEVGLNNTGSGAGVNEWVLDGWFQLHHGKGESPLHEIVEIWTYDPHAKLYRAWGFMSPGVYPYESAGTWDETTSTLTYRGKGPGDVVSVSTMRFIDPDHRIGHRVATDLAGKVVQDTLFKITRLK